MQSTNSTQKTGTPTNPHISPLFNDAFLKIFGSQDSKPVTQSLVNAVLDCAGLTALDGIAELRADATSAGGVELKSPRTDVLILSPSGDVVDLEAQRRYANVNNKSLFYASKLLCEHMPKSKDETYANMPQVIVITLLEGRKMFKGEHFLHVGQIMWKSGDNFKESDVAPARDTSSADDASAARDTSGAQDTSASDGASATDNASGAQDTYTARDASAVSGTSAASATSATQDTSATDDTPAARDAKSDDAPKGNKAPVAGSDRMLFVVVELDKVKERYTVDDVKAAADESLAWIYLLASGYKDDETESIMGSFPSMKEFAKRYNLAVGDPEVKRAYDRYIESQLEYNEMVYQDKQEAKRQGHEEGRKEGFKEGLEDGRKEGFKEGLEDGRRQGRKQGRMEGHADGLRDGRQGALDAVSSRLRDLGYDAESITAIIGDL